MTGIEKLNRIKSLLDKGDLFRTYKDNDEIVDLQKGIKVSDFFMWLAQNGEEVCKEQKLLKMLGTDAHNPTTSWNTKLEKSIDGGYVKRQTIRDHGRYMTWISLTKKGKKLLGI